MSALDKQVGGKHYKEYAIQPIEYSFYNKLNFLQGNIVKYATRYKDKKGKEDLLKVIHYAELLIELEYPDDLPEAGGVVKLSHVKPWLLDKVGRKVPNPRK